MAANRHRLPMDFDVEIPMTIQPSKYQTKTELHVPLHGRVLVWEGHDYFAHHRRVPIDSDLTRQTGIEGVNANRYASDLVIVNDRGEMFHDDPLTQRSIPEVSSRVTPVALRTTRASLGGSSTQMGSACVNSSPPAEGSV